MCEQIHDMTQGWNSLAAEMLYACVEQVPEQELAFYERRIRSNGGLALDQACGTGRHLFALSARGLEVHGADISADALAMAEKEGQRRGIQPVLWHQRMEECDLPHHYGTIYVANGTFQIIIDRERAIATLERFRRHLVPGGQLLLELFVPDEVTQGPACHDAEHAMHWDPQPRRGAEGEIVTTLWNESPDLWEQTLVSWRRYDLMIGGTCVRSETHAHPERWYYHYEFLMMLERAGFADLTTYGDYGDAPVTQESKQVIYAGRRPGAPSQ